MPLHTSRVVWPDTSLPPGSSATTIGLVTSPWVTTTEFSDDAPGSEESAGWIEVGVVLGGVVMPGLVGDVAGEVTGGLAVLFDERRENAYAAPSPISNPMTVATAMRARPRRRSGDGPKGSGPNGELPQPVGGAAGGPGSAPPGRVSSVQRSPVQYRRCEASHGSGYQPGAGTAFSGAGPGSAGVTCSVGPPNIGIVGDPESSDPLTIVVLSVLLRAPGRER